MTKEEFIKARQEIRQQRRVLSDQERVIEDRYLSEHIKFPVGTKVRCKHIHEHQGVVQGVYITSNGVIYCDIGCLDLNIEFDQDLLESFDE